MQAFPAQRSHSRLYPAWVLLFALDTLSPAGLARALPATKAGAAKLPRQLESGGLAGNEGPWVPFACVIRLPLTFPVWSQEANKHA